MTSLSTARLRLRPFEASDLAALARITRDPDVMRFIGRTGRPLNEEQTARTLRFFQDLWVERGLGVWAVEERPDARLMGWCGFFPLDGTSDIELAYLLDRSAWGRGFATEAAWAALKWAFGEGRLERVVAVTYPENTPSRRVLEKLGFVNEGLRQYYERDVAFYELPARNFPLGLSSTGGA
ncbi:GNAT family N-acetyltransferase [Deinococcus yavapaiensis]|nr:GNAT family N-acetyltransferase [Deinococcus yavapaiensis]